MREKNSSPLGVGVISIITILLVLCLTIFAALTLFTARADLNLSEINAETVSAFYAADARAAALYAEFAAGTDPSMEESLSVTPAQTLYLHFVRDENGAARVQMWRIETNGGGEDLAESVLPVWDGEMP